MLLEDETGPRVKNRRVGPPHCRGSAAIPGTKVPGFGEKLPLASRTFLVYPNSGIFARIFFWREQRSRFNESSRCSLAWPPKIADLITRKWG